VSFWQGTGIRRRKAEDSKGAFSGLLPPDPRPRAISGWLIGIVCGVLIGLWAFPPVRYTLSSQLQFAIANDNLPWMRALDSQRNIHEATRLDSVSAGASDDYLLQVGRATALAELGSLRDMSPPRSFPVDEHYDDRTLVRLTVVARNFPRAPGAYAHLARYMMLGRIRIVRAELDEPPPENRGQGTGTSSNPAPHARRLTPDPQPDTPGAARRVEEPNTPGAARRGEEPDTPGAARRGEEPPTPDADPTVRSLKAGRRDVRLMEWALKAGERDDPTNAFWSAMLATTYFAAMRDDEALRALARAARKSRWDTYLYEEVLGQWRLYSTAYGDQGAMQKIGPLSLLAFPHVREMRHMAEMARWYADRAAAQGKEAEAIRIRANLFSLGLIMRNTAQWAYEALCGMELFFIGTTDSADGPIYNSIHDEKEWRQAAAGFLRLLKRNNHVRDLPGLHDEVEANCALRQRVDYARFDASYPGMPPGIPLVPLFGNWMAGILLLQQMLTLGAVTALVFLGQRAARKRRLLRHQQALVTALCFLTGVSATLVCFGEPSARTATVFLIGLTLLLVLGMEAWHQRWTARIGRNFSLGVANPIPNAYQLPLHFLNGPTEVEARWNGAVTMQMLTALILPGLTLLYLIRPILSGLHPVAILLTASLGGLRTATPGDALQSALLASALTLAIAFTAGVWALYRRVAPLEAMCVGLRRLALPAVACLLVTYLLLLNRTLSLDAQASRAINEAAQNDLQWVLTHSEPEE
jgi:hypothetical protein